MKTTKTFCSFINPAHPTVCLAKRTADWLTIICSIIGINCSVFSLVLFILFLPAFLTWLPNFFHFTFSHFNSSLKNTPSINHYGCLVVRYSDWKLFLSKHNLIQRSNHRDWFHNFHYHHYGKWLTWTWKWTIFQNEYNLSFTGHLFLRKMREKILGAKF